MRVAKILKCELLKLAEHSRGFIGGDEMNKEKFPDIFKTLYKLLNIVQRDNKGKIRLKDLSTFIFLVLLIVEGHKGLKGEETNPEVLIARDNVRTDDICVCRLGTREFLFQFLHDGII